MPALLLAAAVCACLLVPAAAAHAEWIVDAGSDLVYEDNLTRAARRADRRDDVALSPWLSIGHHVQLGDATSLLASADVKGTLYPRFEGLSNVAPTLTLGVRRKFGLGASAPWLRGFANALPFARSLHATHDTTYPALGSPSTTCAAIQRL